MPGGGARRWPRGPLASQAVGALLRMVAAQGLPGAWAGWRAAGTRPWGLAPLTVGQHGLLGAAASFGGLTAGAMAAMARLRGAPAWQAPAAALPLAAIVLMAPGDAVLNAFFLFPAGLAAGAIAGTGREARNAGAGA